MDIYTHCYMNISSYSKLIQLGNTEKRTMEELDIIRVMEKKKENHSTLLFIRRIEKRRKLQ